MASVTKTTTIRRMGDLFEVTVDASVFKTTVRLVCRHDRALDQTWTYMVSGTKLKLISVASADSTEIERCSVLRPACRRLAVDAWERATIDPCFA